MVKKKFQDRVLLTKILVSRTLRQKFHQNQLTAAAVFYFTIFTNMNI